MEHHQLSAEELRQLQQQQDHAVGANVTLGGEFDGPTTTSREYFSDHPHPHHAAAYSTNPPDCSLGGLVSPPTARTPHPPELCHQRQQFSSAAPPSGAIVSPGNSSVVEVDTATDSNRDTALTLACAGGHEELVKLLLSRGASIGKQLPALVSNY